MKSPLLAGQPSIFNPQIQPMSSHHRPASQHTGHPRSDPRVPPPGNVRYPPIPFFIFLCVAWMWVLQTSLAWGQPDNDSFQRRSLIQGKDTTLPWFSYRATAEPGERSPLGASPKEASLWWTWRAPESGWTVVTADFAPYSEVTNRLVVAQGDSVKALSGIVEPAPDRVEFLATEGQTYQIGLIVHRASSYEGSLTRIFHS